MTTSEQRSQPLDGANITKLFEAKDGYEARAHVNVPIPDSEHPSSVMVMIDALANEHMGQKRHNRSDVYHHGEMRLVYDFHRMSEVTIFLTDVFKFVRMNKVEVSITNPHMHHKPG